MFVVTNEIQKRRGKAEMKRQLVCVLAAWIGLPLPLGALNAYGAQLPESAQQMETQAENDLSQDGN